MQLGQERSHACLSIVTVLVGLVCPSLRGCKIQAPKVWRFKIQGWVTALWRRVINRCGGQGSPADRAIACKLASVIDPRSGKRSLVRIKTQAQYNQSRRVILSGRLSASYHWILSPQGQTDEAFDNKHNTFDCSILKELVFLFVIFLKVLYNFSYQVIFI